MKKQALIAMAALAGLSSVWWASHAQGSRTKITFWHSMAGAEKTVAALVDGFNKSQDRYEVVPSMVGDYPTANTKIVAAINAKNTPVMFQAEIGVFPNLAEKDTLADLSRFDKTLDPAFTKDFFPALWNYEIGRAHV